jgi:hypothetical protein
MYAFCKIPTSSKLPDIPLTHIKDAEQRFFLEKFIIFQQRNWGTFEFF